MFVLTSGTRNSILHKNIETFEVQTFSLIVWFNSLGLWKIGHKWPLLLRKWQIICNNNKTQAPAAKSYMHCFGFV